jgi:hypothetical protein
MIKIHVKSLLIFTVFFFVSIYSLKYVFKHNSNIFSILTYLRCCSSMIHAF